MIRVICMLLLVCLLASCEKESCTGDCAEMQITGRVIDGANHQGLKNIPIEIFWKSSGMGFLSSKKKIAQTKTDKAGNFKISPNIDKARFNNYYLQIEAAIPKGYIHSYELQERVSTSWVNRFYPQAVLQEIKMYPEATLTIRLVNRYKENFINFYVGYAYSQTGLGINLGREERYKVLSDTTIQVKTSANKYTGISWTKVYGFGQLETFTDSILCYPAKENVFILNY